MKARGAGARPAAARRAVSPVPADPVRSIARPATSFVAPPAVRRAVAGYAAEQGWAPGMTAGAVREGMALALAVAGLTVQTSDTTGTEPWARAVPTSYDTLQDLTGLDRSGVRGALEVLAAAGVLRVGQDDAGLTLTLAAESLWAPHPLLAAAPWPLVSLALARAGAPVRASIVVFAELALETEIARRHAGSPVGEASVGDHAAASTAATPPNAWLELTLKELSHRVGYHLSHVENALAGLEAAGCVTRMRGASGRAMRLAPWTVGEATPPAALLAAPPAPDAVPTSAAVHTVGAAPATGGVVVEFLGARVVMAAGDTLDLSGVDPDGRRVLRIQTPDGDVVIRPAGPRGSGR